MSSRRVKCARCSHFTTAPPDARTIRCFSCSATIKLQPISNEAPGSATGYPRSNRRPMPHLVNGAVNRLAPLAARPVQQLASLVGQQIQQQASLAGWPNYGPPPSQVGGDPPPQRINLQASTNWQPNYSPPPPASEDGDDPPPQRIHPQQYSQDRRGHHHKGNRRPPTQVVGAPPRQMASPPWAFGRKRAVVCGINYLGKSYSLEGSINDAKSMRSFLIQFLGFPVESILMLTEEERSPDRLPTKENMRKAMRWLVQGTKAGDSLFFHYSGHGSRQKDYNGDEQDGQDEALCPLDHETEGKIIDDEINQTLVWPLPRAATLHAVIDACYSATVLDLPFLCKMNREEKYFWENHTTHAYKGTSGGLAICLSACEDHQTSGDTSAFDGKNTGAMTYGFIKAVKSEPGLTYGRLLSLMRLTIREAKANVGVEGAFSEPDLSEEPQLSSSEQFDVHSRKFLV